MTNRFSNPKEIAKAGEEIYEALRAELEANRRGMFVAINIANRAYFLGNEPEEALEAAKRAAPDGVFHLIRIGYPGAFQISHAFQRPASDWLFQ